MQQDSTNLSPGGAIDVGEILTGIWRRKLMVLILTLVAVAMAVLFVRSASPKYSATAKVLVENLETPFTKAQNIDRQENRIDERDVLSQVQVANSPDLALKVLAGLDREMRNNFSELKPIGLLTKWAIRAGFSENPGDMTQEQRELAKFEKNSTIYVIPRSSVIVLEFTSGKPEIAATVANRLAETYVKATRSAQSDTTDRAEDWLGVQVDVLRQKVVESEVAVETFRAQADLVRGTTNTLSTQELSELNSQMILASASKAEALARARSIKQLLADTGSVEGASEVMNSPLIQRLREQQVRVRGSLAELSTTYLDNHPRIKSVRKELVDLDRQVRSEALKIVNSLEQQASIAATREASLRANVEKLKKKASTTGVDEVKLRSLEREASANRQLLESFLTRYSDAASRVKPDSQPGLARVIETATVPATPSFPKKGPLVTLAGVGGLALGLGIAFLLEVTAAAARMQQAQSRPTSMEKQPQMPPMSQMQTSAAAASTVISPVQSNVPADTGILPSHVACVLPRSPNASAALSNAQSVITGNDPVYSTSMQALASHVLDRSKTIGAKRLAVATLPGADLDGAVVSVATARCLAEAGVRVVVVEANSQDSKIALVAGVQRTKGLAELISGNATFADVIVRDELSLVHFVGPGLDSASSETKDISMVMEALDHAYDLVLLYNGVTNFPADKDHTGITACQYVVVVAAEQQDGEAVALRDALTKAGIQTTDVVHLSGAANHSDRLAMAGVSADA